MFGMYKILCVIYRPDIYNLRTKIPFRVQKKLLKQVDGG